MKIEIKIIRNKKPLTWIQEIKKELKHLKSMAKLIEKDYLKDPKRNYKKEFWEYIQAVAENKINGLNKNENKL